MAASAASRTRPRNRIGLYYPYTSLKYHTLLAAALLDNYRAGHDFADLFLVADPPGEDAIVPHRTVLSTGVVNLRVTETPGDRPAARLGDRPACSFADVLSRLPEHPLNVDGDRVCRVLDAELRRIGSWSTALQFTTEFLAWQLGRDGL